MHKNCALGQIGSGAAKDCEGISNYVIIMDNTGAWITLIRCVKIFETQINTTNSFVKAL